MYWLFFVAAWYNVILKSYNVFLDDILLKTNGGASYFEVRLWKDFFSLSGFLFLNCYDFYPFFLRWQLFIKLEELSQKLLKVCVIIYTYCSLRKQPTFCDVDTGFPAKWRLRNERRNSMLMTRHYPDLGCAFDWSIRSTTQIWVLTRHQYGIAGRLSVVSRNVVCFPATGIAATCR